VDDVGEGRPSPLIVAENDRNSRVIQRRIAREAYLAKKSKEKGGKRPAAGEYQFYWGRCERGEAEGEYDKLRRRWADFFRGANILQKGDWIK